MTEYITVDDSIYELFKEQADRIKELELALAKAADRLKDQSGPVEEMVELIDKQCPVELAENVTGRIGVTIVHSKSQCRSVLTYP